MEGHTWLIAIFFQIALIALNSVFACAEAAVISASDSKLEKAAEDGDKRAKKLLKLTKQPAKFLATIQIAITLAGFLGSAFAAENFAGPLTKFTADRGVIIPEAVFVVAITLALSYFTLVFGELVPKRAAMRNSEKTALKLARLVTFLAGIFKPAVWFLTVSSNCVLRLIGIDPDANDNDVSEEDIRVMVDSAAKNSNIDDEERDFIENIFEFDDLTAGEIATHRTDVTMLWLDEDAEEWNDIIHERCHMFYPVCGESVDDVVGVLYLKDYFRLDTHERNAVMEKAVKKPYFVPESVKADVLFKNMKAQGRSFAIVLDEYGGMLGIVTMNDLITRLVGEFGDDESASAKPVSVIEQIDEQTWRIKGDVSLEEISEAVGLPLPEDDFDTFSAAVFSEYGSIPNDGETFEADAFGLHIRVTEVADHQIESAIIDKVVVSEDSDENDDE